MANPFEGLTISKQTSQGDEIIVRIKKQLGSGAQGGVYKATRTITASSSSLSPPSLSPSSRTEDNVAVKVLTQGTKYEDGEIQRLKELNHENIVRYLDDFQEVKFNAKFLVMEYIAEGTLAQLLDKPFTLPPAYLLRVATDIAKGMQYIYSQGICHRDMKPSNILIVSLQPTAPVVAKVGDFGFAKKIEAGQHQHTIVGTAGFIAPEVWKGEVNFNLELSDVYSFGKLVQQMIDKWAPGLSSPYLALLPNMIAETPQMRPNFATILTSLSSPPPIPSSLPPSQPRSSQIYMSPPPSLPASSQNYMSPPSFPPSLPQAPTALPPSLYQQPPSVPLQAPNSFYTPNLNPVPHPTQPQHFSQLQQGMSPGPASRPIPNPYSYDIPPSQPPSSFYPQQPQPQPHAQPHPQSQPIGPLHQTHPHSYHAPPSPAGHSHQQSGPHSYNPSQPPPHAYAHLQPQLPGPNGGYPPHDLPSTNPPGSFQAYKSPPSSSISVSNGPVTFAPGKNQTNVQNSQGATVITGDGNSINIASRPKVDTRIRESGNRSAPPMQNTDAACSIS